VKRGRVVTQGIVDFENGRQTLDLHPQFVKGLLTGFRRQGRDRSNPVPDIAGVIGEDPLVFDQHRRGWIARAVEEAPGHIPGEKDRENTADLLCLGFVDAKDPRMGVRTAKDGGVDHAGQIDVIGVTGLAGHLGDGFVARKRLAYDSEGFYDDALVLKAAFCTACTIFT